MRAAAGGSNGHGPLRAVIGLGIDNRPSRLRIDALGPAHGRKGLAGDERSGHPVNQVKEPVLVGLHDDLAKPAVDAHVREQQVRHGIVIPVITRSALVIPLQLSVVGIHRDDGRHIQVVHSWRSLALPDFVRPGRGVTHADIKQILVCIVGHAVPDRAAAAELPPFTRPGLRGFLERRILERFFRIAGNGIEPPELLAGVHIEGGEVAAIGRVLGAGIADDDFSLDDSGGHREGVGDVVFRRRLCGPQDLAVCSIEPDESSVDDGNKKFSFVDRETAIDYAAADPVGSLGIDTVVHFRIVAPDLFARTRIDGERDTPVGDTVDHAIHGERSRFLLAASGSDFRRPCKTETAHVRRIDLLERAVPPLGIV